MSKREYEMIALLAYARESEDDDLIEQAELDLNQITGRLLVNQIDEMLEFERMVENYHTPRFSRSGNLKETC